MSFEIPEGHTPQFRAVLKRIAAELAQVKEQGYAKRHLEPGEYEARYGELRGLQRAAQIVAEVEKDLLGQHETKGEKR